MSEVQPPEGGTGWPHAPPAPGTPRRRPACHDPGVSETVARRVVVHGSVQGVFFRDTTRRRAQSRGVSGWVRNRSDGTVEALFEGAPDAVDSMVAFAGEGPRGASVERVDVDERAPEGLAGFEIR
jgi:acylphosphatase